MEKIFKDKVVIVTGGSFGIGRSTALAFAEQGAKVVIADWLTDKENETASSITRSGGEATFIKCDVSSTNDVKRMVEETVTRYGKLDAAFNNAGIEGANGITHECTEENWDKLISINLKGIWLCMKYEIPEMLKAGGGAIVNCASIAGMFGFPGLPAYVASKHAILGLTKTASLEYAKSGIRVNAVCPGVIHTAMIDRVTKQDKEVEQQYIAMEPVGRMGNPSEVGAAVTWLCSGAASFVTGISLPVDGGFAAG
jgi:NAD(P)-dependent dehydrogenase (short-subunit alcohol dehydrogenase family)